MPVGLLPVFTAHDGAAVGRRGTRQRQCLRTRRLRMQYRSAQCPRRGFPPPLRQSVIRMRTDQSLLRPSITSGSTQCTAPVSPRSNGATGNWHKRKKATAATGSRVTTGMLSTQMAMTSSTRTPKTTTSRRETETGTETASSFRSWMCTQVELEPAGQARCPERDSNPYGLSAWEV
jgi:hypothetical protein